MGEADTEAVLLLGDDFEPLGDDEPLGERRHFWAAPGLPWPSASEVEVIEMPTPPTEPPRTLHLTVPQHNVRHVREVAARELNVEMDSLELLYAESAEPCYDGEWIGHHRKFLVIGAELPAAPAVE